MPNHVHGIILIDNDSSVGAAPRGRPLTTSREIGKHLANEYEIRDEGQPRGVAPTDVKQLSLSDVMHRFKSFTTHLYTKGVKDQKWVSFPGRLWQRNYYERIIREDSELATIREYTENNPCSWDEDEENPNG